MTKVLLCLYQNKFLLITDKKYYLLDNHSIAALFCSSMLIRDLTFMLTIWVSQHLSVLMITIMASKAAVRLLNSVCG